MADKKKHPAYGLVGFHRQTGGNKRLFGSQVKPNTTISLRVYQASVEHDLSRDSYYPETMLPLVEVELSPNQFAELLTTMNVGHGIPCTIKTIQGKRIEDIPETDKPEVQKIQEGFEEKLVDLSESLAEGRKEVAELLKKKSLTKEDKARIDWILGKAHQEVQSNMPFVMEQFSRSTQKIVTQAKAEVDAFAAHAIQVTGLEAIAEGRVSKTLLGHKKGEEQ